MLEWGGKDGVECRGRAKGSVSDEPGNYVHGLMNGVMEKIE